MRKIVVNKAFIASLSVLAVVLTAALCVDLTTLQYKTLQPVVVTATLPVSVVKPVQLVRSGMISNALVIAVNSDYTGQVGEVYVAEGQVVQAGQALVQLDALPEQERRRLATMLKQPERQPIKEEQAEYEQALKKLDSYQQLYAQGAISRRQLEAAEGDLKRVRAALANGQNDGSQAPTDVLQQAAVLKAPIAGRVTGLTTVAGATVLAGQQLMALGSGQEVEVLLTVEQSDLYLLPLGASVLIDAASATVNGHVAGIYPRAEGQQVNGFTVHIQLIDQPQALLQAGMNVNIRIDCAQTVSVTAVPLAAVQRDVSGQAFIYAAADSRVVRQTVTIGQMMGEWMEITSPIPTSLLVITNKLDQIKEGDVVRIAG